MACREEEKGVRYAPLYLLHMPLKTARRKGER